MEKSKGKSAVKIYSAEFFLFLLYLCLSCLNGWSLFKLSQCLGGQPEGGSIIYFTFLIEYLLVSMAALCFTAFVKGGFSKLKKVGEHGLLFWLVLGLIVGFVFGLAVGLSTGLFMELFIWFGVGLGVGLSAGLFVGLGYGLFAEFGE